MRELYSYPWPNIRVLIQIVEIVKGKESSAMLIQILVRD